MSGYRIRNPVKLISIVVIVIIIVVMAIFLLYSTGQAGSSSNTIVKGGNYSSQIYASNSVFSITGQKSYTYISVDLPQHASNGQKLLLTNLTGAWTSDNSVWAFFMNQSEFSYFEKNSTQLPVLDGSEYVTGYGNLKSGTLYVDLQQSTKNINGTDYYVFLYPSNYTGKYYTNITLTQPLVLHGQVATKS